VSAAIKLSAPATRGFWEIAVLFEDEHLLALDKPAGLLTSPDRHDEARPSLMQLLLDGLAAGKPWARERSLTFLGNAHRPDFETSGVILLAKKSRRSSPSRICSARKSRCANTSCSRGAVRRRTNSRWTPSSPRIP
jgi:23S rRNA-/tRNA-specific pseudouridylate synthase